MLRPQDLLVYLPMDRRQALSRGETLPERAWGTALFADISGFTPLTEALVRDLGPQRGAEELTRHLGLVYETLITELWRYGGSVIGFSGDAITCWLDGDSGLRGATCALAMQQAMEQFAAVTIPSGRVVSLAMKAALATGRVRRFLVGDPRIQSIEVLAGSTLYELAAAEHQAAKGEVLLAPSTLERIGRQVEIKELRIGEHGERFGVLVDLLVPVESHPWPDLPEDGFEVEVLRDWLLPPVFERLRGGRGEFLGEFRPAVALFLRFTGLDYDEDPQVGQKLDAYVRWVQSILKRYEGYLMQLTIGDKGSYLCAVFGAPVAHEDDPQRAAFAALELRCPPSSLGAGFDPQIGITRGVMRTGAYGGSQRRTYGVLSDEVNLAARLMQAAAPGQIIASKPVWAATLPAFTWEALPEIRVKGKAEPVTIFSLAGLKTHPSAPAKYFLPMVGRQAELSLAIQKLDLAASGRGQVLGIVAEAGIGKTRLIAEIVRLAEQRSLPCYTGECESYGADTSYLVWQNVWREFFNLDPNAEHEDQASSLQAQLAAIDPFLAARLPLLGTLLRLPVPDNDLTRSLDAKLRKTSLEALLVDCLRARALAGPPQVIVLEDCHWLDPLSQDLLDAIARAAMSLPVLLILAYRPEQLPHLQAPRVSKLSHFTGIHLAEFEPEEAERLIHLKLDQFFGEHAQAQPAFIEKIIERAGGNPFYIEELLNYLQDKGIGPLDYETLEQQDLPSSLNSLILSRIDQLTENQTAALKVASAIGRLFKAAMLWGVYPQLGEPSQVLTDLETLARLDLTQQESGEPEVAYLFKHVLTQEVTYESLQYATRAILHEHIGKYIEEHSAGALDQAVDLLAYHYERSQNTAKKREYLLKAGQAAQGKYANTTALHYYRRVLPLLSPAEQVGVMIKLGQVLELVGQWSESRETYRQALEQAEQVGDLHDQARCQAAMAELLRKQGLYGEASSWLDQAQASFEALDDPAGVGQVLHYAGSLATQQGNYPAARWLYEQSLAIRRQLDDQPHIAGLLSNLGIVSRMQGEYELASQLYEESLGIRRKLGDRWAIAVSLNNLGNVALDLGDFARARLNLEEAVAINKEIGDKYYIANSLDNLGNVTRAQGDYAAACELYHESLTLLRDLGDGWLLAYLFEDIGCLAAATGQAERALRLAAAAAALREKIGAPLSPSDQARVDSLLAPARAALPASQQDLIQSEGRQMTLEQAIQEGLRC